MSDAFLLTDEQQQAYDSAMAKAEAAEDLMKKIAKLQEEHLGILDKQIQEVTDRAEAAEKKFKERYELYRQNLGINHRRVAKIKAQRIEIEAQYRQEYIDAKKSRWTWVQEWGRVLREARGVADAEDEMTALGYDDAEEEE